MLGSWIAPLLYTSLGLLAGGCLTYLWTRRKDLCGAMESALRESNDRLRWAVAAASDIIWDWDLVSDSIYHPSWAETYGFPPDRTPRTGAELLPFLHPEDLPRFHAEMTKAVEGQRESFEVEHRAITSSGDWKWMLGRGRVVTRDGAGRATRIVGTCTDITEKKRMLAQVQIADRMASVGTLAAGVIHELNTPLACVLANVGYCQQILQDGAEPTMASSEESAAAMRGMRDPLEDAGVACERMRDILRDMKSFSRMDETRTPVVVGAVLRAALRLADHEMRGRARVVLDIPRLPSVLASESRLSQLFVNLLINAAQAVPSGEPARHEIRVTGRQTEDGLVEVSVRDTGCGIRPEHLGRLFDPFFTTKSSAGGTGLGLSICHGIVTSLGGEIAVESEMGKGSTFTVTLPAVAGTAEILPEKSPPPPAGATVIATQPAQRVLDPSTPTPTPGLPRIKRRDA